MKRLLLSFLILITCSPAFAQKKQTKTTAAPKPQYRIEKDLLGEKQIPFDAYYGVQTARALENFQVSGIKTNFYPDYVRAYAIVKLAAARANSEDGRLSKEKLDAIEKACQAVMDGKYHDQFLTDMYQGGAGTSANMNANEVLANIALELSGHKKGEYKSSTHSEINSTLKSRLFAGSNHFYVNRIWGQQPSEPESRRRQVTLNVVPYTWRRLRVSLSS
jgi:aspartate ammonia-lyase